MPSGWVPVGKCQARQGVAKLPIQILGALIGKFAIIGVMRRATLP